MAETNFGTELYEDGSVQQVDLADGAASGLKLGSDVVVITGNQSIDGVKTFISLPKSSAVPSADNDLVNKAYVDAAMQGQQDKASVHFASIADIGGTYASAGGTSINGAFTNVDLTAAAKFSLNAKVINLGERIILKDQIDAKQNGIYVCTVEGATGAIERASDMDTDAETLGASTLVLEGAAGIKGNRYIVLGEIASVINTNNIIWTEHLLGQNYTASLGVQLVGLDFRADFDNVTINLDVSNRLQVKDGSIGLTKLAPLAQGEFYFGNDLGQIIKAKRAKEVITSNAFSSLANGGTYTIIAGIPLNVTVDFEVVYRGAEMRQGAGGDYTIAGSTVTNIRTTPMQPGKPIVFKMIIAV